MTPRRQAHPIERPSRVRELVDVARPDPLDRWRPMTAHEKPVGATVEWYTPASLFARLGFSPARPVPEPVGFATYGRVEFDLDPAAAPEGHGYVPAKWFVRPPSDGAAFRPWFGHVWLNPPYGPAAVPFIDRMIEHGDGLLLLPSRTETAAYQRALIFAGATCFLRDRLWFVRNDGVTGRSSFGSTLFAFGPWAVGVLDVTDLGYIATHYNPRVLAVPA